MKKNSKIGRKEENIKWEYDIVQISKYRFECCKAIRILKEEVNERCKMGWIPEGAPNFVPESTDGTGYLIQNIIRPVIDSDAEESKVTLSDKTSIRPAYDNITMTNEF